MANRVRLARDRLLKRSTGMLPVRLLLVKESVNDVIVSRDTPESNEGGMDPSRKLKLRLRLGVVTVVSRALRKPDGIDPVIPASFRVNALIFEGRVDGRVQLKGTESMTKVVSAGSALKPVVQSQR